MKGPDFFIVGAPKCGTTSLAQYLAQHPRVFMCEPKEPFFFGTDLTGGSHWSRQQYEAMFARSGDLVCGEATTWYLYSKTAAKAIYRFNPEARIIIMLRNPVDAAHSLYGQLRFNQDEDIEDFAAAIEAQERRRRGQDIPDRCSAAWALQYTDVCRFSGQVQRFLETFGRRQVWFVIFDDFQARPADEVRRVYDFLGLDPGFRPDIRVLNRSKRPRSRRLQRLLRDAPTHLLGRLLVPPRLRPKVAGLALRLNSRPAPRPPLPPKVHADLAELFRDDVRRLGDLLGRDRMHWCRDLATTT